MSLVLIIGIVVAVAVAVGVALNLRAREAIAPPSSREALPPPDDDEDEGEPPTIRESIPDMTVEDVMAGEAHRLAGEAPPVVPVPAPKAPPPRPATPRPPSVIVKPPAGARPEPPAPVAELAPTPAPAPAPTAPAAPPAPVLAPPPVIKPVPLPVEKPRAPEPSAAELRARERERFKEGLAKTRGGFVAKLARLFRGRPKVDDDLKDDIEEVLFTADIGAQTAEKLQARVTEVLDRKEVADSDAVWSVIREAALEILDIEAPPLDYAPEPGPYVLLMIGVNGVGKTTTLGKLAATHVDAGRKVLLVAGDTFRAAAVEQLDVWARRVGCDIHSGSEKADPSSVIFDGISRGRREGYDVVMCDTAGRLHTRKELMDELAKVGRAATKALQKGREDGPDRPHDIYLVLDATIGQNALAQAQLFKETMAFTGLVVTKLDGTAKGGVVLGICDELGIPIRFVGIGEGVDDLRPFDAEAFCDALLFDRDREGAG